MDRVAVIAYWDGPGLWLISVQLIDQHPSLSTSAREDQELMCLSSFDSSAQSELEDLQLHIHHFNVRN